MLPKVSWNKFQDYRKLLKTPYSMSVVFPSNEVLLLLFRADNFNDALFIIFDIEYFQFNCTNGNVFVKINGEEISLSFVSRSAPQYLSLEPEVTHSLNSCLPKHFPLVAQPHIH